MQCPKCQLENPGNRKFCRECGTKLVVTCPKCEFKNIPSDKFCGDCGHDLTQPSPTIPKELSFEENIAKIQKYLPSGIAEKILSQRDRIEGEKRMRRLHAVVRESRPRDYVCDHGRGHEILIHKVHDYEGTVNEMTGDGVIALFGAPIALEDAPQKAIRSAMAIWLGGSTPVLPLRKCFTSNKGPRINALTRVIRSCIGSYNVRGK